MGGSSHRMMKYCVHLEVVFFRKTKTEVLFHAGSSPLLTFAATLNWAYPWGVGGEGVATKPVYKSLSWF